MATATPTNRLKLTPSNSPYLSRPSRSPMRGRALYDSKLALKRVVGTTCSSPTGFDTVNSSFAYIAGGAVVVVDVDGQHYAQRFFRARPTAVPVYSATTYHNNSSSPASAAPKANDSRNRVAPGFRESPYGTPDWSSDSPTSKTWTSRERIKAATCVSLSRDGRHLAVGETGYAPRVLIFSLQDTSSSTPLVSISEHSFGVKAVAWSPDSRYLASLGEANDGGLYVWKVDPRTGAARLFQQNRCTSYVRDMTWLGNNLITLGVRHVKMWRVEDGSSLSPTKQRFLNDSAPSTPTSQKTLPGRNILLGSMLEATFTCAAADGNRLILCTEMGDVCILDEDDRQTKLLKVLTLEFSITSITIRNDVAYVGGKCGKFATLDVDALMNCQDACILSTSETSVGLVALGFLTNKLVTIDSRSSVDIWGSDYLPGQKAEAVAHIPISGHGEPIVGIQPVPKPNILDAAFMTWSGSGNTTFWDLQGSIKSTVDISVEMAEVDEESELMNQLTCAQASRNGKFLVTGDRQGNLKVTGIVSRECILDTKAHSSDCTCISLFERDDKFLMASCGRDRTAQLFHRTSSGGIEHFQTLEFASKVVQVLIPFEDKVLSLSMDRTVQVHDLVTKEGEPDIIAAIPSKIISLKASPTSMSLSSDNTTLFVSQLDRSITQFELATGRQISWYKCMDESAAESAVLESLSVGQWLPKDMDFLLGTSNTDKSIRLYEATSGSFLDREWGHTEGINGVALIVDDDESRKVVSVGSDGTIMIWALDLNDPSPRSMSRDPSPAKDGRLGRPTLRRVLSRAELAEFQRPPGSAGRRSPPRTIQRRTSRFNLAASTVASNARTPTGALPTSPESSSTIIENTPSRRPSGDSRATSPPSSPKSRLSRRPSLPALGITARRKSSAPNLRAFGTLNMSTEQACRTLRAYRKKLSSAEPISAEVLTELDQELRLTAAALGDRAIRSKAMNETVLSGLLDEYSERLVTLLDEKMRLNYQPKEQEAMTPSEERRGSADGESSSSSSSSRL